MGWKFNPFTGALDQTGSGGGSSYIDGEVATYADLPLDGTAALNSAWLVREASGTWLLGRKPAGIYIRTATAGSSRDADYTYAGILPDVFSDANFTLYDESDSTKNAKFQLSGIATGTTRTITVPDKNVTLDDAGDSRTPAAHTHVSADITDATDAATANAIVRRDAAQGAKFGGSLDAWDIYASGIVDGYMFVENGFSIASKYAAISHTHGNITNDGKVGVTAGLPLKTGTAGAVEAGAFGVNAGEFAEGNHTHADLHTRSHAITSTSDHSAGNHKVFYSDGSGQIQELALGNSGEVLTSNGATSAPSFAAASGGGVTTGSVDNAIIRADGTGGSTSQSSDIVIDDATTSTQANVAIVNVHSETNSSIVLTPKGTGALIFGPKPAGTGTTGNARGAYAVDFGRVNFSAALVASGTSSAILGGENNQASGSHSCVAGGQSNAATGGRSFCAGFTNTASGNYSMAAGFRNTASGTYGATALGGYALADRQGLFAVSGGKAAWTTLSSNIVSQWATFIMHGKTTTNAAVELLGGDTSEGTARLTVPASRIMHGTLIITGAKSDGTAVARYMRQFSIKNVSGTTSLVGTVDTIGVDEASGTSISVTANDTNDALKVEVTGITSETWRWNCVCHFGELTYGT